LFWTVLETASAVIETAGAVTPAGRDIPGRVVGTDSRILACLGGHNQAFHRRRGLNTELEDALGRVVQQLTGALEEQAEFGLRMRGADVFHDLLPAAHILGDLHCRRSRARPHPPDERHTGDTRTKPISA
jgi:hypothetical protein